MRLWAIEFGNNHWCGGDSWCVVWADDEDEAVQLAVHFMDDYQYDLFSDHYEDEPDMDDGVYAALKSVEPLEESRIYEFYLDPEQREAFYPCVNPQDAPE